jgi:cyanate permease
LIYGVILLGWTAGASVGPFLSGYIFDVTNSYQTAFLVTAGIGFLGVVLTTLLKPTGEVKI